MKRIYLSIIFTAFSAVLFGQTKEEKLQQLVQAYATTGKLNGAVLITQKGKTLLHQGYGLRDVANKLANDANTVFQIGSVTKQFTAAVILKLQEQGKLNGSDKISLYIPDYPNGDNIRIEHLLTHTSGIFNYTDDRVFMQTQSMKPISPEKMLAVFKDKPLKFAPGTDFEYSNSNYILLGYIIEKVTAKPYAQVVDQMIFKPLKMKASGFDFDKLQNANKATGYAVYSKDGGKASEEFDPTVSFAAGGMYTTTGDLNQWLMGFASGKIISKDSYNKAITPYKNHYGYGNYINPFSGKTMVAHGGLTFGYTSYLGRVVEDDLNIVILNNIVNYGINDIANGILAVLYDKPYQLPEVVQETAVPAEVLQNYIGTYQLAPQVTVAITVENGQLYGQATGQGKIPLSAKDDDSFFIKGADVQIDFKKDAANKVQELILTDSGNAIPAKRIN